MAVIDITTLRLVLDRLIPRDTDPGATDLGVDGYVLAILAADRSAWSALIAEGLSKLADFATFPPPQQDGMLRAHESEPWFRMLCELAAEGFYADSGNGGNRGEGSWAMIGYEPRLPEDWR